MAALTDREAQAIERMKAAARNVGRAAEALIEAIVELKLSAADLGSHAQLDYEAIAISALEKARAR